MRKVEGPAEKQMRAEDVAEWNVLEEIKRG